MSVPYTVARVNCSLPCAVPVVPGTPNTAAPIEQRTEFCAVDGYWVLGSRWICDHHFRTFCATVGDDYGDVVREFEADGHHVFPSELRPWVELTRYDQDVVQRMWADAS